ncbi:MAG: hypothetical protein GF308_11440 [Candidatus Heimdallarchaeota archaeon]|nr:hypothetical protein [Candidatus Heimdallarchaeota archaeon]
MIKNNKIYSLLFFMIIISTILFSPLIINVNKGAGLTRGVQRYGILVDQFAPNSNKPGNYFCNAIEFRNSLLQIGWSENDFHYLFGEDEITIPNLQEKMDFLEEKVDENDVVVIFFATHGHGCLRDILNFNDWFHQEFLEIKTDYKVLLIDACHAGEFIEPLITYSVEESFYAMASVAAVEFAIGFDEEDAKDWQYSEPQFYGIISAHFWSLTLVNQLADLNDDSYISLREMSNYSLPTIKKIYSEVFLYEPELRDFILNNTGYIDNYPNPLVVENLPEEFSLYSQYFAENIEKLTILTKGERIAIILGSIGGVVIIGITISIVLVKKKGKKHSNSQDS